MSSRIKTTEVFGEDKENETIAYLELEYSHKKKNPIQTAIEYYEKALEIKRKEKIKYIKQSHT